MRALPVPPAAFALLLALLLQVGCTTLRPLPEGWSARTHLESERFAVETDVPTELAPRTLQVAEAVHAELAVLFGGQQPPRTRLLVFADQYDFGRYHGAPLPSRAQLERERREIEDAGFVVLGTTYETPAGHYRRGLDGQGEVAIFYQGDFEGALRHEMAHVFLHEAMRSPPPWLDEGVAELARLRHDGRERERTLSRLRTLERSGHAPALDELVRMPRRRLYETSAASYAMSWLLVQHLVEVERTLDLSAPGAGAALGREVAARMSLADLLQATGAASAAR